MEIERLEEIEIKLKENFVYRFNLKPIIIKRKHILIRNSLETSKINKKFINFKI